ncbi:MAG: exo-beta-N-acetylmuramidase NamZ domain-containing protein, partial [Bacteroidales bacterium]
YFPLIANKQLAVVANPSSLIEQRHLVDILLSAGMDVVRVFSPEHGFRGKADAGELVGDGIDLVTGLPIISLYGKNRKPQSTDLENVDLVVFDIQDVGARFYTYISTMSLVMEACAENDIPVIVFDRPNPNGFYVDGPVLKMGHSSFVGMHPVPVVHGMTVGEYAQMVNGEYWLPDSLQCDLTVIPVKNYAHAYYYEIPVPPSPNLPNKYAVYLYPSLCLFEGTNVSVGRGTDYPFQIVGHPDYALGSYIFVPRSIPGAATHPKHEGVYCNGHSLIGYAQEMFNQPPRLNLTWLIVFHDYLKDKTDFFNSYFVKLAGTTELRKQIEKGWTEEQIRGSWQPDLEKFKKIRKKYLLYPDFE